MFADDCLVFYQLDHHQCETLKDILARYEKASGKAINFDKLSIFFSQNVGESKWMELSAIIGVNRPLNMGRYLGLSSLIGQDKNAIFRYIRDRLWDRLSGWRTKKISHVRKEVLIKSAAQVIPTFCMTSFSCRPR